MHILLQPMCSEQIVSCEACNGEAPLKNTLFRGKEVLPKNNEKKLTVFSLSFLPETLYGTIIHPPRLGVL